MKRSEFCYLVGDCPTSLQFVIKSMFPDVKFEHPLKSSKGCYLYFRQNGRTIEICWNSSQKGHEFRGLKHFFADLDEFIENCPKQQDIVVTNPPENWSGCVIVQTNEGEIKYGDDSTGEGVIYTTEPEWIEWAPT